MDVAVGWLRWVCTVEVVGYLQQCQERRSLVALDDYTVSSISTVEQCGSFCIDSGEKENDQCDCRVVGGGV